jgi:hypothetical protein
MRKLAPFLLIAGFVALLIPRMMQSMAQGDAYPEWSTLRSDPLGAKVLFVALERVEGVAVSRNYEPWKEARPARALYVMLGVSPLFLQDSKEITKLTGAGGELLVGVVPSKEKSALRTEKLGFVSAGRGVVELKSMEWACLDGTRERCRLARKGHVTMLVDGAALRNGELLERRDTELLARVFGGGLPVVFDESHLGVNETGGVGVLLRRYRLFPALALLLGAALLFVWRSSVSLLPEREPVSAGMTPQPAASLRTLLAQRVPRGKILETLVGEWKRALPLLPLWHRGRVDEMDLALERAREFKDVRAGYSELQAAVRLRKGAA